MSLSHGDVVPTLLFDRRACGSENSRTIRKRLKMAYAFKPESQDYTIVAPNDDDKIVGKIRIKPSGVLWSSKGGHKYYKISLADFAKFAEAKGKGAQPD